LRNAVFKFGKAHHIDFRSTISDLRFLIPEH
jgi:hypothetical protein